MSCKIEINLDDFKDRSLLDLKKEIEIQFDKIELFYENKNPLKSMPEHQKFNFDISVSTNTGDHTYLISKINCTQESKLEQYLKNDT